MQADLIIKNAAQIVTAQTTTDFSPASLKIIEDGALVIHEGKIVWVGEIHKLPSEIQRKPKTSVLDAHGKTVTAGFVDAHTHPIFFGTREDEFEMRVMGKSYEEIAQAGGGIRSSVRSLRNASREQLIQAALPRLDTFLAHGTTTIEAKSGYGLSLEDEIKSLEVIAELNNLHPVDLVPTFLGAHEIPDEYRSNKQAYIDLIIQEMIPEVVENKLAEFCDVFCEAHVFNAQESRKILQAAKEAGLKLKIHADQLTHNGGAQLAAELQAVSADHLEFTDEKDWQAMLDSKVVPVLLPGAVFFIGKSQYARAREMLQVGLPVAIATDFNPGTCMTESMPLIMTLSCLQLKLTPAEALIASTYHSALAIDRGNKIGTLEVGKKADVVIWDVPNYKHLAYHFGVNLANTVIKNGKIVW
ncbi:MAG: imidazolonepropionase [Calditrichaeota bacterium]|nr:MAG: imidazolonepropionase [Calditrichota bacterium]